MTSLRLVFVLAVVFTYAPGFCRTNLHVCIYLAQGRSALKAIKAKPQVVIVLLSGTGVSQACTIVDVSRCYAPLLSKVELLGYCRALPETKYCIRRLMSNPRCHVYLRGAMQDVLNSLQMFSEGPRCRRYSVRRPNRPN